MNRLLLAVLLLSPCCLAQITLGNFGTQVRTTGPILAGPIGSCPQTGGIETITPNTPIVGQATVLTALGAVCGATPLSINFTATDWDGGPYTVVSHDTNFPQSTVIVASQTDPYDITVFPNGDYAGNGVLVQDSAGTLWNFFKSCAQFEATGSACVAVRKSTDGGATWSTQVELFFDPGTSCNGGTQACLVQNQEVGYISGGNIAVVYRSYDPSNLSTTVSQTGTCNPTSVDCTNPSNWINRSTVSLVPAGEPGGFLFCQEYGTMVNLPGGALGLTINSGTSPVNCGSYHEYMLISCDQGVTYGTGTGCVGLKASYASTPYRRMTTPSGGYVIDPLEQELSVVYIGETTLYGLARNAQWTSGCAAPCGQLIQWVSTDMGLTWSNALTNIGNYPSPTGNSLKNYTEVSPVLFNPGLGGLWMLVWADRGQDSGLVNYTQNLVMYFNPSTLLSNPTGYPANPTQFSYTPGLVLGGYPAVAYTGVPNQLLLQWDGSAPRIAQALAIWQETTSLTIKNAYVTKGKIMQGVTVR